MQDYTLHHLIGKKTDVNTVHQRTSAAKQQNGIIHNTYTPVTPQSYQSKIFREPRERTSGKLIKRKIRKSIWFTKGVAKERFIRPYFEIAKNREKERLQYRIIRKEELFCLRGTSEQRA